MQSNDDFRVINVCKRLFADGYISAEQLSRLKYDSTGIINDLDCPADVCDNGDVYVHCGGAYPLILKGYCRPIEQE
jgi:hypothetical protein